MIMYAGDTHGDVKALRAIDAEARSLKAQVVIQVGDFGVHFSDSSTAAADWFSARDRAHGPHWITCGGNHDNWPKWRSLPEVELFGGKVRELAPGCFFADRGTVLNIGGEKHIFFGGAESIDKMHRVEGRDWWPEESPDYAEYCKFMDSMELHRPPVVVTHEAPSSVQIRKLNRLSNPTPRSLEGIFRNCEHKPARWYFGHHHIIEKWNIDGTDFICTGMHGEWSA